MDIHEQLEAIKEKYAVESLTLDKLKEHLELLADTHSIRELLLNHPSDAQVGKRVRLFRLFPNVILAELDDQGLGIIKSVDRPNVEIVTLGDETE